MSVNSTDILDEVLKKIDKYFEDPKNVEDFKNYLDEEMKKPYMTQLQCNCMWCEHNGPEDPDMGTITYCNKFKNGEEDKCAKECGKREWYECVHPILKDYEEDCVMKITNIRVNKVEEKGTRLRGYASITIDDCFAIHDIKLIQGENEIFLAMPSKREKDGRFRDIAHPINAETRKMIQDAVIAEYNKID